MVTLPRRVHLVPRPRCAVQDEDLNSCTEKVERRSQPDRKGNDERVDVQPGGGSVAWHRDRADQRREHGPYVSRRFLPASADERQQAGRAGPEGAARSEREGPSRARTPGLQLRRTRDPVATLEPGRLRGEGPGDGARGDRLRPTIVDVGPGLIRGRVTDADAIPVPDAPRSRDVSSCSLVRRNRDGSTLPRSGQRDDGRPLMGWGDVRRECRAGISGPPTPVTT